MCCSPRAHTSRVTQALSLGPKQALGTSVGTPLPTPPTED